MNDKLGASPGSWAQRVLDAQTIQDPYPFYRNLQAHAPVWQIPGTQIFFVSSYALVDEASKRVADFSSNIRGVLYRGDGDIPAVLSYDHGGRDVLATADPPAHAIHKNAIFPSLVAKRMARMEADVAEFADAAFNQLGGATDIEFMSALAFRIPVDVVVRLVGFQGSDHQALLQLALDSSAMVGGALTLEQLMEIVGRNMDIFDWLAAQLDATPADEECVLFACQQAVANGVLSADEAKSILHILLAAAGESTSSLIGNAARMLAEDPPLQQSLRENPAQVPAFLEEVLRLESPFRSHLRSVPADTSLGGCSIPGGSTVLLFWGAGNRDPQVFHRPDAIDLSRPRKHLAFGRGIHTCVGAPLARLEAKVMIETLLARTNAFHITAGRQPIWAESLQMRRHDVLPLTLHWR